jgi:hypothetical protein
MMGDTFVQFGPKGQLVGVLTGDASVPQAPVLVLPSAGVQPRAGPFRLHVELGQRLATHGLRTFRFDIPGVGEAPRLNGFDARAATLAAIDKLATEHGCERFVVGGLCSAADLAWVAAVRDPRVQAVLMLDGVCYPGPWYYLARVGGALRKGPAAWAAMLRRRLARWRHGQAQLTSTDFRDWPELPQARREFTELLARDVRSLWIYTGTYRDCFLHPRQFGWAFGPGTRDPRVVMHHWPDCDHLFYARAHKDRLLDTVESWFLGLVRRAEAAP